MAKAYTAQEEHDLSIGIYNRNQKIKQLSRNQDVLVALLRTVTGFTLNQVRNKVDQMGGYGEEI